jgi:transposase
VDVWVTYQLAGATVAASQHECGRRTVYRWIDRVEADPSLLADGRSRLEARRKARDERNEVVRDAAREALLARITEGRVSTKYLAQLVLPETAPARGATTALQVPAFMTTPRTNATEAT